MSGTQRKTSHLRWMPHITPYRHFESSHTDDMGFSGFQKLSAKIWLSSVSNLTISRSPLVNPSKAHTKSGLETFHWSALWPRVSHGGIRAACRQENSLELRWRNVNQHLSGADSALRSSQATKLHVLWDVSAGIIANWMCPGGLQVSRGASWK